MTKIISLDQTALVDAPLQAKFEVLRDPGPGLDALIAAHGAEVEAVVTRGRVPMTGAIMDRLPRLKLIANFGVGYDSVDVAAAAARGIVVTNTPDVLNDEMADFTVGLMIATVRRFPQAERHIRAGKWAAGEGFPLAPSLRDRHVGIVGMGRIGRVIARRLDGFDIPVSYHARSPRTDLRHTYHEDLLAMARAVDTLVVVLPGGAETRNIVDRAVLEALGANGILINVARGSVVDEAALIAALKDGTILAAGLDVFAHEPKVPEALIGLDNVVLLPHIGTATHHTRGLMGDLVVRNVVSWFEGKGPITPVAETPVPGARAGGV